jgi:diacylglycerol kinase family enzyme
MHPRARAFPLSSSASLTSTGSRGGLTCGGLIAIIFGTPMKLLLIYNPHAAHGNALGNLSSVEELFRARGLEFDLRMTLRPGHAVELVRAADLRSYDGLLDVTLLSRINRRRLLQCFPLIFTGKHVSMPEVETFKAQHISIVTDRPKVLTPDGELLGGTPVEVECLPRDVEVFWK